MELVDSGKKSIVFLVVVLLMTAGSGAAIGADYTRDLIGIEVQDLSGDLATYFKMPHGVGGILVTKIIAETPAAKAGLLVGDIITTVAGLKTDSVSTWFNAIPGIVSPEKKIDLSIIRDGKKKNLSLIIPIFIEIDRHATRGPDDGSELQQMPFQLFKPSAWAAPRNYLGVVLHELNKGMRDFTGYNGPDGVFIYNVIEGTPAEKAGFKAGDVLISIDGIAVENPARVKQIITEADKAATLLLTIFRDGKEQSLNVSLEFREGEGYSRFVLPLKNSWHEFRDDFDENVKPELKQDLEELRQQMLLLKKEMQKLREDILRNEVFAD